MSVLDFEKQERQKEVAELEQTISGSKEELSNILHQQVRAQLERMKQLCKERNSLYEKQNDLKGQKWKLEKLLER